MSDADVGPVGPAGARAERIEAPDGHGPATAAPRADLENLVRLAARLCHAPVGLVMLVDEVEQAVGAAFGFDGPSTAPLDTGFSPIVVERNAPLVIPDTQADPAYAANPAVRSDGIRFYAGVPLVVEGRRPLGTLCVLDKAPRPTGLSAAELDVLLTLAAQAVNQFELRRSLAQRDALLADQHATLRERDALSRVQAVVAAADGSIDTILEALVSSAMDAIPSAEAGVLELIDGDVLEYRAVGGTLVAHGGLRVPVHGSLSGSCATSRTAILLDDAWQDGRVTQDLARRIGLRSAVLAPVSRGDQVLGVLKLQSSVPARFTRRDLQTISLFAGVATSGLTEVRAAEAQRAMMAGARRQAAIFDSAVDFAIIATDRDGRVTDWNAGAERILGWTVEEVRGGTVDRIFTPEDRASDRPVTEMRLALEGGRASDERWHLRRDGARFWSGGEMMPLRDSGDDHIGFLKILRDRTAEHRSGAALRQAQQRFQTILDTIDAAFAIVEVKFDADERPVDYRFLEVNPAFERQAGVNLRGRWVTEHAPDLERFWFETYGHVARTGEPANFESYAEAFGRWFDVRAVRVGDPADRQIAILFNDVTARRDAESRLRASEALARENAERVQLALGAGAIIGTWHWDIPTDRFRVDDGFAEAFGLDPALGHEGIPLAEIVATVHPDDRASLAEAIRTAIARGGSYAHQYRVRRTDGTYHWIEANGRVDHAPDGTPLSFPGVLIDIEEQRAVEAERDRAYGDLQALNETLEQRVADRTSDLMAAEAALRQSQKMEAVGQLTGGLAHDFNNLLTGIIGSLELLSTRLAQGRVKDMDRYVGAAQGAAKRAAALTHRLLAFSRRQTLDPKPTDLNRLVAGMEDLIRRTIGPSIALNIAAADDLHPILVDPPQLENALLNLCINARDAMPGGGRLVVETANRTLDERAAGLYDLPGGRYVTLCVSDTGTGMAPDVIAKAFEPFFTTKPLGLGTGLGLSMIYGFARQSGGQVRIHSQVGLGTNVCLYLPRHVGKAEAAEAVPELADAPRATRGETVLVVDDEPTIRMLVTEVLEELGYQAVEAADGASGLVMLQSEARIDLLVTDVGLPGGMNGRQMADAARTSRPNLKVLFITGYAETAVVGDGNLEPGMEVMTKPFAMEALAIRIKDMIARR